MVHNIFKYGHSRLFYYPKNLQKIEQYYTKHVTRLKYTMTSGTKGKIMGDCDYNLNS